MCSSNSYYIICTYSYWVPHYYAVCTMLVVRLSSINFGLGWKGRGNVTINAPPSIVESIYFWWHWVVFSELANTEGEIVYMCAPSPLPLHSLCFSLSLSPFPLGGGGGGGGGRSWVLWRGSFLPLQPDETLLVLETIKVHVDSRDTMSMLSTPPSLSVWPESSSLAGSSVSCSIDMHVTTCLYSSTVGQ